MCTQTRPFARLSQPVTYGGLSFVLLEYMQLKYSLIVVYCTKGVRIQRALPCKQLEAHLHQLTTRDAHLAIGTLRRRYSRFVGTSLLMSDGAVTRGL